MRPALVLLALAGCSPGFLAGAPGRSSDPPGDGGGDPADEPEPAPVAPAPEGSGCEVSAERVRCPYATVRVDPGPLDLVRDVHVGLPPGEPPDGAWPVVFLFQGSFYSGERYFRGDAGDPYGGYWQARVTEALLGAGFAVIAPETRLEGATFWDTNVPPYSFAWSTAPDHHLTKRLLELLDAGDLGGAAFDGALLDPDRLYATGVSSGGYMTSRMAVSYRGRFRALAVHSASYATCSGFACVVPRLPADHPPTRFLHGDGDLVVPIATARAYLSDLRADGVDAGLVSDPAAGHEWIAAAPDAIVDWFLQHP